MKQPVFIVGLPRSGTTLVSNLLNATNELYIPEETHIYESFNRYKNLELNISFTDFFLQEKYNPYLNQLNLKEDLIEKIINSNIPNDPSYLLELICSSKANEKNILRWGEKTPIHSKYVQDILANFKNALIINVLRDPRDVMLSIKKAGWQKHFLYQHINEFRNIKAMAEKKHSQILFLKYEDILLYPLETLKPIFEFLNLNFDPEILNRFYKTENINFHLTNEPWKKNNLKPIDKSQAYKWKYTMSSFEVKAVNNLLKTELEYFGYEKGESNFIEGFSIEKFLILKNFFKTLIKKFQR